MTHKFAVIVDRFFYYKVQNNNEFYLRVIVLDVLRSLVSEEESVSKYSNELFNRCLNEIAPEVRLFEDEKSVIFYLELSSGYLEDFFEKPLDDFK